MAVGVLSAVAVLLLWALERELDRAQQQELDGKVDVVRHFLDEVHQPKDLLQLRHHLDDVLIGDGQMRIWLVTDDGVVIYGGRQRPRTEPLSRSAARVWREDGLPMEGRLVRLAATAVLPSSELIVAVDTREQDRLLANYRRTLAWVCGLGVALMVLLASGLARRALKPVARLSSEAAAISAEDLSVRLSAVDTVELAPVVTSFNDALDRVAAAYEHLEAFSADVAHELRTPLATLIHATEVTLARPRPATELADVLGAQLEQLRELASMVNDMLFLAKAEHGHGGVEAVDVDLGEQARVVADYFEAALEERRQSLVVQGQARVKGNAALLRRALVNLVGNAIRYTEAGGQIAIALDAVPEGVRVAVRNPGPPIDPQALPRLFDRFYRAEPSRQRTGEHHGLGLAIVRAVVTMHGGKTFARSAEGATEVGLVLPRS
jgi:two-component system heavy metal sensor histidine kinase CusS